MTVENNKQLVEVLGLVQSTSGFPTDQPCHHSLSTVPLALRPLGDLVDFRRQTNSESSGNVDKELFTSFLNPKNVFPAVVLLGLVLRSVLNRQGVRISLILQISAKKNTILVKLVRC